MGQHFIVPSIRGRDIGFLKWPDIRSFKHLLELLDFINYAFDVHPQQYSQPALTRHLALWHETWFALELCQNRRINERRVAFIFLRYFANRISEKGAHPFAVLCERVGGTDLNAKPNPTDLGPCFPFLQSPSNEFKEWVRCRNPADCRTEQTLC